MAESLRNDFDLEILKIESSQESMDSLLSNIHDAISSINSQWSSDSQLADFAEDFHDLWYMVIRTAQTIDAASTEQDRLFYQLIYAKELGVCSRWSTLDNDIHYGQPWRDLPHLTHDVRQAWELESMNLTVRQRTNFASFTARLMATKSALNIDLQDIESCITWLMRETLETETRPLVGTHKMDQGNTVSVADLLPAVAQFCETSGHKILSLAIKQSEEKGQDSNGENGTRGFSVDQWLSWRARLGHLSSEKDSNVAEKAKVAFRSMIATGKLLGYDVAGEKQFWSRTFAALDEELLRSGKDCVEEKDIVMDPKWAEE